MYTLIFLFFLNNLIKTILFVFAFFIHKSKIYDFSVLNDSELPIYTLLIPVYREKFIVIKNLLEAINNFNYDINKIEILLLLEEDDISTIENANKLEKLFNFKKIIVPYSIPRTKPKACNVGLQYANGKYLVIYDAEDRPEPDQLKKAIIEFESLPNDIICLQARLNYYNANENLLTKCFSLEYSIYFDYNLQMFSKICSFFPLSGTSNHFKMEKLKELNGWDSYNVTEDAELGVRIGFNGYRAKTFDSITLEESVIDLKSWKNQRTRWVKGFIHTYLEYMLKPIQTYKNLKLKKFLILQFLLGVSTCFPLLYLFYFINFILFYRYNLIVGIFNLINLYFYLFSIIFIFIIYLKKRKELIDYNQPLLILYYLFYSFLPFFVYYFSLTEFIVNISKWNKTTHGKSKGGK